MPLYEGDGTELGVSGFQNVYEGDGTILWSDELSAGTRIYTASQFSSFRTYNVTQAYTARDLNNTETISSEGQTVSDIFWKPNGEKFYETSEGDGRIYQYNTENIFSIEGSTLEKEILSSNPDPTGAEWSSDGQTLVVSYYTDALVSMTGNDPFDIGTLDEANTYFPPDGTVTGVAFNDDGAKMYTSHSDGIINEYNLSTAFDISTASHTVNYDISNVSSYVSGLTWSGDGMKLWLSDYALGQAGGFITLNIGSNPFDLSDVAGWSALSSIHLHNPSSIDFNGGPPHADEYDGDPNS